MIIEFNIIDLSGGGGARDTHGLHQFHYLPTIAQKIVLTH